MGKLMGKTPSIKNKENLVADKTNIRRQDNFRRISVLNTEIMALRSFIIKQFLVIKTMAKKQTNKQTKNNRFICM